jgi:hypothetical protein
MQARSCVKFFFFNMSMITQLPNEDWIDMIVIVGDEKRAALHVLETMVKDCLKASGSLHQYQDSIDFEHLRSGI